MQVNIRPVQIEDAPIIQELATSHPDIVKQTRLPDPYPDNGAQQWIEYTLEKRQSEEEFSFAIENHENKIVGVCGLTVKQNGKEAELGYWIGEPFWKNGYATSAIRKALQFAFETRSFLRVFALSLENNIGSKRALEKNGFVLLETRPDDEQGCNTGETVAIYEFYRKDWK